MKRSGAGSLYYREDRKCWYISFKAPDGKWKARKGGRTKAEAVRTLRKVRAGLARRTPAEFLEEEPEDPTVSEAVADWLERRSRRGLRNVRKDESHLRIHVLPTLGEHPIREVRPVHVRRLIEDLTAKGLAPRTVRLVYGTVHKFFNDALADERIDRTPCTLGRHELPKNEDKDPAWREGAVFRREEVEMLISSNIVPEDRRVLYALLFFTGGRVGEIAGLRWRDLDERIEPLHKLVIARSYDGPTKAKTTRQVPVHPTLAGILSEWRLRGFQLLMCRPAQLEDSIIPSRAGEMRSSNQVRNKFYKDLDRLGMRRRRVHDTRRTMVSLALADGARKDVLERITHGPRGNIMDLYVTLPWKTLCEAISCLDLRRRGGEVVQLRRAAAGADSEGMSGASDEPTEGIPGSDSSTGFSTKAAERARYVDLWWKNAALRRRDMVEAGGIEIALARTPSLPFPIIPKPCVKYPRIDRARIRPIGIYLLQV